MQNPFRQLATCLGLALLLVAMVTTGRLNGQELYPSMFEDLSEVATVGDNWFEPGLSNLQSASPHHVPQRRLASLPPFARIQAEVPQNRPAATETEEVEEEDEEEDPPKINGNSLITQRFNFQNWTYNTTGFTEYVVPGRIMIGENNSADTDNRLIFRQVHFHNAIDSRLTDGVGTQFDRSTNVDQYVLGFERTLDAAQQWSLEMRLPLFGSPDQIFANGFSTQNLTLGNVVAIFKRKFYEDQQRIFSTGLGMSAPTGDDTSFIVGREEFTLKNQAVHIAPFLAGLWTPTENWFFHGFLTVDMATNSNQIEYRDLLPCGCPPGAPGKMTNQTLMNIDLAAGYWWYRKPDARWIKAISSLYELHYVTSLSNADAVSAMTSYNNVEFGNNSQSLDLLNATFGFDFNILDRVNLRFATVAPLQGGFDRIFDAEFQTSINWLR